jgi:hypothetical protein
MLNLKDRFKKILFQIIRKLLSTNGIREELFGIVENKCIDYNQISNLGYHPDTYTSQDSKKPLVGNQLLPNPIFITARFRSGSTLLWNIFRSVPQFTAYYEPLINEFPSQRGRARQHKVDPTHWGVKDYHSEYSNIPGLDDAFRIEWATKNLYMGSHFYDPVLEKYLRLLIENAKDRPVLQFNRVDFRLPWLRAKFPKAFILHLYRNPRDQWISMIKNDCYIPKEFDWDKTDLYPEINAFYLWDWWRDLHHQMPFLKLEYLEHPYQLHYLIWRASYIFGKNYSDLSIKYEDILESFEDVAEKMFSSVGLQINVADHLSSSLQPRKRHSDWAYYASGDWFETLEESAESLICSYFSTSR